MTTTETAAGQFVSADPTEDWCTRNLGHKPTDPHWIGRIDTEGHCRWKASEADPTGKECIAVAVRALDPVEHMAWRMAIAASIAAGIRNNPHNDMTDCAITRLVTADDDGDPGDLWDILTGIASMNGCPPSRALVFAADEIMNGWAATPLGTTSC